MRSVWINLCHKIISVVWCDFIACKSIACHRKLKRISLFIFFAPQFLEYVYSLDKQIHSATEAKWLIQHCRDLWFGCNILAVIYIVLDMHGNRLIFIRSRQMCPVMNVIHWAPLLTPSALLGVGILCRLTSSAPRNSLRVRIMFMHCGTIRIRWILNVSSLEGVISFFFRFFPFVWILMSAKCRTTACAFYYDLHSEDNHRIKLIRFTSYFDMIHVAWIKWKCAWCSGLMYGDHWSL